jgi:hypothetical protein
MLFPPSLSSGTAGASLHFRGDGKTIRGQETVRPAIPRGNGPGGMHQYETEIKKVRSGVAPPTK